MKIISFLLLFIPLISKSQYNIDSIITEESLKKSVSFLANDSLKGRMVGSPEVLIAANFIKEYFKENGLKPLNAFPLFYDSFKVNNKLTGINIVAAVPGFGSDSLIIVSAHYDHIGKGSNLLAEKAIEKDDQIYNGANDNATGTAAMMEIAKYYSKTRQNYYSILFVAFSAEELGMLGSVHFANNISKTQYVKAVVNLEMLGRPYNKNYCFYTGSISRKTIRKVNYELEKETGISKFFHFDIFPFQNLDMRSDHYSFKKKVSRTFTIMATSTDDKFYHSIKDETKTIDFDFLCKATKNIAIAIKYVGL